MALPTNHPLLKEQTFTASTNSIASTPLACAIRAPFRGVIVLIGGVSHGAFTTDCSVAVVIKAAVAGGVAPGAGTAITGSPLASAKRETSNQHCSMSFPSLSAPGFTIACTQP